MPRRSGSAGPFGALAAAATALREELLGADGLRDGALDWLDPDALRGGQVRRERIAGGTAQLFAWGTLAARWLGASGGGVPAIDALNGRLGGNALAIAAFERVAAVVRGCEAAARLAVLVRELPVDAAGGAGEHPLGGSYEAFLAHHDPDLRRARGVYYTPATVAAFVVERVDRVLADELGLGLGIAAARDASGARLDVLDPAAGTGAFLAEVVRHAWRRVVAQGGGEAAWRAHVKAELLPRLRGIELLPVAWLLCELRLVLALDETGYELASDDRLGVQLADALGGDAPLPRGPFADALAREREEAARLLGAGQIGVVLTNPPYRRGARAGNGSIEAYKRGLEGERNLQPLADDHVRFVRLVECLLGTRETGVCGLVANATMLSGRLYRGMRRNLVETFGRIDVIDLHGSSRVRRREPGAVRDENLFDVGQGIALAILRRRVTASGGTARGPVELRYTELWGARSHKEAELRAGALPSSVTLDVAAPDFAFVPRDEVAPEYARFLPLDALFSFHSVGGKPGDDAALVGFDAADVLARLGAARAHALGVPAETLSEAGRKLARLGPKELLDPTRVARYLYRPFDTRFVYDDPALWTRPVMALRAHVDGEPLLLASRIVNDFAFAHVFVSRRLPDVIALSSSSSGNCYAFPASCLRVVETRRLLGIEIPARAFFAYVYAVLHAPCYRARYRAALAIDFPRVPLARAPALVEALVTLGERLLALHLGEAPLAPDALPSFVDGGDRRITRARGGALVEDVPGGPRLYVNTASWLAPVSRAAWEQRIGGYRVLQRWLAERKRAERPLADEDVEHVRRLVATLDRTRELASRIDAEVEHHGGWPGAFAG